ncbi:MAG: hypothetical protein Q9181_006356 [Wetmoreana brouardii]
MDWPYDADYGSPEIVPVVSRGYPPTYNLDQPLVVNPHVPYALPVHRPPVRANSRYNRPQQAVVNNELSHYPLQQPPVQPQNRVELHHRYSKEPWQADATLTDGSQESDVSEALSGDSFTFDGSVSETNEKQTGEMSSFIADSDEKAAEDMNGSTPAKPSPYTFDYLRVRHSRWTGDPLAQWACSAELSTYPAAGYVRKREQELFHWITSQKLRSPPSGRDSSSSSGEEGSYELEKQAVDHARDSIPTVAGRNSKENLDTHKEPTAQRGKTAPQALDSDHIKRMPSGKKTTATQTRIQKVCVEQFHVFYWQTAVHESSNGHKRPSIPGENRRMSTKGTSTTIDTHLLDEKISQMHTYLTTRRAYIQCPLSNLHEVEASRENIGRKGPRLASESEPRFRQRQEKALNDAKRAAEYRENRHPSRSRRNGSASDGSSVSSRDGQSSSEVYSSKVSKTRYSYLLPPSQANSTVRLSKQCFEFFFPLGHSSQMTQKYWGAVHWLLHVSFLLV